MPPSLAGMTNSFPTSFTPPSSVPAIQQPSLPAPKVPSTQNTPQPSQPTPEGFKTLLLAKYPNGVSKDGTPYVQMDATKLAQAASDANPDAVTSEGHKYSDYLPKQPGFFQGLAKSVLGPVASFGVDIKNGDDAVRALITGKGAFKAQQALNQERTLPILGNTAPTFNSSDTLPQVAEKGLGTAAQIAALGLGGEGTANVVGDTIGGKVLGGLVHGATTGLASGALSGAGSALADPTNEDFGTRAKNTIENGAFGGLVGGFGGAALGAATPVLGKVARYAFGGGAKQAASDLVENVGTKLSESKAANDFVAAQTPEVQNAVNRGVDPGDVKILQNSSPEDITAAQKMMDIKQGNIDGTIPTHTHLPIEIPGQEIVNQANHLAGVQDSAGQELNRIVSEMPAEPQDTTHIANRFLDDLQKNNNVKLTNDGTLDFSRSNMRGSTQNGDRSLINSLWQSLQPGENGEEMTPQDMHSLRQSIFEDVGLGKQQKVLGVSETPAINLRNDIASHLDNLSDDYKNTNKVYAQATGAVNKFNGMIGKPFDFSNDGIKALRAGEIAQRVLGNASARPISMLNELGDTARSLGYKGKADIFNLTKISDMLDDYMGNTQTRGLQGQMTRAVESAQNKAGAAAHIASGEGITGKILNGAKAAYNYAAEAPQSVKTQSLRNLLQSLVKK